MRKRHLQGSKSVCFVRLSLARSFLQKRIWEINQNSAPVSYLRDKQQTGSRIPIEQHFSRRCLFGCRVHMLVIQSGPSRTDHGQDGIACANECDRDISVDLIELLVGLTRASCEATFIHESSPHVMVEQQMKSVMELRSDPHTYSLTR